MVFLDINTFFGPKAGGIRTYHQAKVDWFVSQSVHTYILIYPGDSYQVTQPAPTVFLIQVYGIPLTRDRQGYRLILDYFRVGSWIRKSHPHVVEAGDAWLTSWFLLGLKALGFWKGTLVSFYHSDPFPSYVIPWSQRGQAQWLRRILAHSGGWLFDRVQKSFDWTVVASKNMEKVLHNREIHNLKRFPFGVQPAFFQVKRDHHAARCLYAGRLDGDKGVDLLLKILPSLLEAHPTLFITVAGRGALSQAFASFHHPRYQFAGFVAGPEAMANLYATHSIFLAPGPFETFGLAILEAMAAGLIVIGPNAGGCGELLEEVQSPFAFPAGDSGVFQKQILGALASDIPIWSLKHKQVALNYGPWDQAIGRMIASWKETS